MPYCYGNLFRNANLYDDSDMELSERMMNYWVNFAKTGDPNGEGLPKWEAYRPEECNVMEFGDNCGMVTDPYSDLYPLFDKYQQGLK